MKGIEVQTQGGGTQTVPRQHLQGKVRRLGVLSKSTVVRTSNERLTGPLTYVPGA